MKKKKKNKAQIFYLPCKKEKDIKKYICSSVQKKYRVNQKPMRSVIYRRQVGRGWKQWENGNRMERIRRAATSLNVTFLCSQHCWNHGNGSHSPK